VARIPDAYDTKQRTVAYLHGRGRGNRCFCRHELITIVTPLSRPGSARTAASVCLYSVYRKQERSLFTAALEQTSNVLTAIIRPRPTAGLWSPIPSIRSAIASLRRAARLLFDRCATAPETRPLLAVSRAHPSRVQRCPTGRGRRGGKSSYSGEIDYRFLTFQTVPGFKSGYRFSGCILTSLLLKTLFS